MFTWLGRLACVAGMLFAGAAGAVPDARFTIAVVPDTQNYVDYTHQVRAGYPFDAADIFLGQMDYIARHAVGNGGDIAFVTSVGDLWQHQSKALDDRSRAAGLSRPKNVFWDPLIGVSDEVRRFELPLVERGYGRLDGLVPFSVVPGNHDFDAMWSPVEQLAASPDLTFSTAGALYSSGLENFRSVFSSDSRFFKNRPWYVAWHDGGADSAQVFAAGGYRFLHIGLQFDPPDASLAWAARVIGRFPGVPTIVTTHNYLDDTGGRRADPVANNRVVAADANTPEMVWRKLIRRNDQIFMVLCGHRTHAYRVAKNVYGHEVHQIMSNYQGRRRAAEAAGVGKALDAATGDGWLRLMQFDMGGRTPRVRARTYSTYFKAFSTDLADYAAWYRGAEKPRLTDEAFNAQSDFVIVLSDFAVRFPRRAPG